MTTDARRTPGEADEPQTDESADAPADGRPVEILDDEQMSELSAVDEQVLASRDTIDDFIVALEERKLAGHSKISNRAWAMREHGVQVAIFDQCDALIQSSWAVSTKSYADQCAERDVMCAHYLHVYRRAMERNNFDAGIKALDSIARMRNLDNGQTIQVNFAGQITNTSRERVSELLALARARAASKTLQRVDEVGRAQSADSPIVGGESVAGSQMATTGRNGSNGNGKINGAH